MDFRQYVFPFDEVDKGSRIVIYGAGVVGSQFVKQVKSLNYCNCLFVVDKNFHVIQQLDGIPVYGPNQIVECTFDKIIIASADFNKEIHQLLINMGVQEEKIINKQSKILHNIVKNFTPDPKNSSKWDEYYDKAEKDASGQFNSYFKPILSKYEDINLNRVLDFACGHGRMANQFSSVSKNITCCDVNTTAIDFCKNRFANASGCSFDFLVNMNDNGRLAPIPVEKESFTFIYSWDAMVHFAYKWLDFYIKEFYSTLQTHSTNL